MAPVWHARRVPSGLLLAGILGTLAGGALIWLAGTVGVTGAKPLVELTIAAILIKIYPEDTPQCWSIKRVTALVLLGATLFAFWMVAIAWGNTRFPDLSTFSKTAVLIGIMSSVVTAPIYEEKVVRHLLLQGLSGYMNGWVAAVLVSAVFALVHQGSMAWSFLGSMVLCSLALVWKIGVMQRAIVHGAVNALIMLWYLTRGFGFFA